MFAGIIFAELGSPAFFSFERGARDCFGNRQQIFQIERGMLAGIEFPIADDTGTIRPLPEFL